MSKVVLIYPGTGVLGFDQVSSVSGEARWISHGLALIGANLKKHGHEVSLIDMRILSGWSEFAASLKAKKPDVVGVSASYLDFKDAKKACSIAKESGATTVMGGILPSVFPEEAMKVSDADYIITGEGEITMIDLLESLSKKATFPRISAGKIPDLDSLPFADRGLYDYDRELSCVFAPGQTPPVVTMIAGRGCPYQCRYCQPAERAMFPGKFRMRSPKNVIDELALLRDKYNFNSITFWDDTFTVNKEWIFNFCDLYDKEGFTANMAACCRADIICNNPDMIERLAEVGLTCFVIGFETGTDRMLDFIGKGVSLQMNIEAARICRRNGIKVFGTFMLGLPTETRAEAKATMEMIEEIKPDHQMIFYFNPIPGTYLYDYCKEADLILREDPFDIERTDKYRPTIRGVDYEFLGRIMKGAEA